MGSMWLADGNTRYYNLSGRKVKIHWQYEIKTLGYLNESPSPTIPNLD